MYHVYGRRVKLWGSLDTYLPVFNDKAKAIHVKIKLYILRVNINCGGPKNSPNMAVIVL
jgi:hypothetical protein